MTANNIEFNIFGGGKLLLHLHINLFMPNKLDEAETFFEPENWCSGYICRLK